MPGIRRLGIAVGNNDEAGTGAYEDAGREAAYSNAAPSTDDRIAVGSTNDDTGNDPAWKCS
jgi:hypothetical protein